MSDFPQIAGAPIAEFEPTEFCGSVIVDGEQYDYVAAPDMDGGCDVYWTIAFSTGDWRHPRVEFPPVPDPSVADQMIRAYFMGREHGGAR